jgi:hypothetical protein
MLKIEELFLIRDLSSHYLSKSEIPEQPSKRKDHLGIKKPYKLLLLDLQQFGFSIFHKLNRKAEALSALGYSLLS